MTGVVILLFIWLVLPASEGRTCYVCDDSDTNEDNHCTKDKMPLTIEIGGGAKCPSHQNYCSVSTMIYWHISSACLS